MSLLLKDRISNWSEYQEKKNEIITILNWVSEDILVLIDDMGTNYTSQSDMFFTQKVWDIRTNPSNTEDNPINWELYWLRWTKLHFDYPEANFTSLASVNRLDGSSLMNYKISISVWEHEIIQRLMESGHWERWLQLQKIWTEIKWSVATALHFSEWYKD